MSVLHTPPGFDLQALLAPLNSAALEHSSDYRRAITRTSPLLFGLVYLLHHMQSAETGTGVIALSDLHIGLARLARRWVRPDLGPQEVRDAVIAPRGAAKSTWTMLGLPLWATAHRHRMFPALFSDSGPQVRQHFANLKRELDDNLLLRTDYPELCEPARLRGRSDQDTQVAYVSRSGAAFMAKGITSSLLGAKHGNRRPDLLLLDDIEPTGSRYSSELVAARLEILREAVLAMNPNAAVLLAGTVVRRGSIMHDLVRAAIGDEGAPGWTTEEGFRPWYWPAILVGDDGRERSLWPQRWSLEFLQSIRHTRGFALNFANLPPEDGDGWWSEHDVVVDSEARGVRRGLWIDPAVTKTSRSDFTGLAVVGLEGGARPRAVVEWVRQVRVAPDGLRHLVGRVLARNPSVRTIRVEANQGGDVWLDVLAPLRVEHPAVQVELHRAVESKADRFTRVLDWYQQRRVVHARPLPALVDQLLAYPDVAHDDVMDAVAAGVEHWLGERSA